MTTIINTEKNAMTTGNITINPVKKQLMMSERFYNRACIVGNGEYYEMQRALNENPSYKIAIKKSKKKQTYSKLTYKKMEIYISYQSNAKELLVTFNDLKKSTAGEPAGYPVVKQWFLEQFEVFKNKKRTVVEILTEARLDYIKRTGKEVPELDEESNEDEYEVLKDDEDEE